MIVLIELNRSLRRGHMSARRTLKREAIRSVEPLRRTVTAEQDLRVSSPRLAALLIHRGLRQMAELRVALKFRMLRLHRHSPAALHGGQADGMVQHQKSLL